MIMNEKYNNFICYIKRRTLFAKSLVVCIFNKYIKQVWKCKKKEDVTIAYNERECCSIFPYNKSVIIITFQ